MAYEDSVSAAMKWSEDEESEEGASSDCISHIVVLHCSLSLQSVGQARFEYYWLCRHKQNADCHDMCKQLIGTYIMDFFLK